MAPASLSREERVGLALAAAAHVGLIAFLALKPPGGAVIVPPERITVTLADEVGLTSTSPEPMAQAAPDIAPELGETEAKPEPAPEPLPVAKPEPKPLPLPKPVSKPAAKAPAPPQPKASPKPAPSAKSSPVAKPVAKAGGNRIGSDFLKGVPGATSNGTAKNPPAAQIGPAVQSALAGAISRQLKPKWAAPQGVDAEKLVTVLAWSLNRDGSLASAPRVVRQDGITDANRAQAQRHAEQAVRAVQLAAPFDLPDEYYDAWKRVASFRFDKRLSQ